MIRDDKVLEVFRELPGQHGCSAAELDAAESELGVSLPQRYRELMQLDAARLCGAGIVAPIQSLLKLRQDATQLLVEDRHSYRLDPDDVVFAWDGTFAFYFFKAYGNDDPPVKIFNYYNSEDNWAPVMAHNTLTSYFIDALRRYLNLS